MGEATGIEWTDKTWNPWHGCLKVSPGCKSCYMYRDKARYGQDPMVVQRSKTQFSAPLKWYGESLKVFTCSWSDFFIEQADAWRAEAWEIIRRTPHLTYQILTKRPELMADRLPADWGAGYRNVWLGVSVENQKYADERIPLLLQTPAAVRFLSVEPQLEAVNLWNEIAMTKDPLFGVGKNHIDWVICGGESGPGARPFDLEWAESLLGQCRAAGVPFFMKQIGSNPYSFGYPLGRATRSKISQKGGDPAEWPEHLRVREFPERAEVAPQETK